MYFTFYCFTRTCCNFYSYNVTQNWYRDLKELCWLNNENLFSYRSSTLYFVSLYFHSVFVSPHCNSFDSPQAFQLRSTHLAHFSFKTQISYPYGLSCNFSLINQLSNLLFTSFSRFPFSSIVTFRYGNG